jgi:hypothetical protein
MGEPDEPDERKPLDFDDFTQRERRIFSAGFNAGYHRAATIAKFTQMFGHDALAGKKEKKKDAGPD